MPHQRPMLVTSALPYANGPIHLGHLVEYIQTDIWVRYQRLRGRACTYICADDTHGTPIMLKAEQEGTTPEALIARIGIEHARDFADFAIAFDHYGSTHCRENQRLAEDFFARASAGGHIAVRTIEQAYDPVKNLFLPDRFIKGTCPRCAAPDQYGDSCEVCGATYAPADLKDAVSVLSGVPPTTRTSEHYFFKLNDFADALCAYTHAGTLQNEATHKLDEWLNQGLTDWDISRDAPYFGFAIPGTSGKYFYVWLDAPVGYIATLWRWCNSREDRDLTLEDIRAQWDSYEVHHFIGKDILYFHALFWPAMLEAAGLTRPQGIHAHGFLTINGKKMSKSRGTFITARQYLDTLNPEYLRYYFAAKLNGNIEDIDLNFDDLRARINADLVGKLVNIASRTAQLLARYRDSRLGPALPDMGLFADFVAVSDTIGDYYEAGDYSRAVKMIMDLADRANRYIDETRPWELARTATRIDDLQAVCTQALNLFRVLITYLRPILPVTAHAVETFLGETDLNFTTMRTPLLNHTIGSYTHLLRRIETSDLAPLIGITTATETPAHKRADTATEGLITRAEFDRIELRVARVMAAEIVANADKLLKLTLDVGEPATRVVFAGIRPTYPPTTLVGRLVICVANLAPRTMRFGISQGMVLAASDESGLFLLAADSGARPGMRVR